MAKIRVEIRARLVGRVRSTVLLLFEASAEALHFTLGAVSRDAGAIHEVRQHFTRLRELAALLDQLGWTTDAVLRDIEVRSSREVVRDAVLGTLLDAGEALATGVHYEGGGVRGIAEDVVALDGLLKEVDRQS